MSLFLLVLVPFLWMFLVLPGKRRDMKELPAYAYAHRGLWDQAHPENSLSAFRRAVEAGYGIELDIQRTRDGRLVVFHDASLKRMCGREGRIQDMTFAELSKLTLAGTDEGIPLFEDVLGITEGRVPLIVELKTCHAYRELCRESAAMLDRYEGLFCVESFDPRIVHWFRWHRPKWIRGQLVYGLTHGKYRKNIPGIFLSSLMMNSLGRPDFLAMDVDTDDSLPFKLVRKLCHTAAWTVSSRQVMEEKQKLFTLMIFEGFEPGQGRGESRKE